MMKKGFFNDPWVVGIAVATAIVVVYWWSKASALSQITVTIGDPTLLTADQVANAPGA